MYVASEQRRSSQFGRLIRLRLHHFGDFVFSKHDRHSIGLPCVGLKGTVVEVPHSEHEVRVSVLSRDRPMRFPLHCLQRLGSFVNCLS